MLDALKFVARGVARRDYVPGLTHFRIKDGRCTGTNGVLSLSCPVEIGFDAAPHAVRFIKTLRECEDVISMTMQGTDILVRSGKFRHVVPCLPIDSVDPVSPEGQFYSPSAPILDAFRALKPFVGVDASKPWAMGILLCQSSAFATNNICVAECWLGDPFPVVCNVPDIAVDEVLNAGDDISQLQISDRAITFHYPDGRWVKTPLLSLEWPNIPGLIGQIWQDAQLAAIPPGTREACLKLGNFCEPHKEHLFFRPFEISTTAKGIDDGGAVVEVNGLPDSGCYHVAHINKLLAIATHADFTRFPDAVPFMGGMLRGAMLGVLA